MSSPFSTSGPTPTRLPTLAKAMKASTKLPRVGVTQGGSSKTRGARPAATSTARR